MKRFVFLNLLLSAVFACAAQQTDLHVLATKKEYLKLNAKLDDPALNIRKEEQQLYKAVYYNVTGQIEASQQLADSLVAHSVVFSDSLQRLLLETVYDNDVKRNDYKSAYASGKKLVELLRVQDTAKARDEAENVKIWEILQNEPPQRIVKKSVTVLPLKRDMAKLWNIPVRVGQEQYNFVFDSGAGISVITESYADKLHVYYPSQQTVDVTSGITGLITKAKIGVAPSFDLGQVHVSHAVFMVFPDQSLEFGGGVYKIHGIIGFPVICGLSEFSIQNDSITIAIKAGPEQAAPNMILEGLLPVIYLGYGNDTLPFTFDTGAQESVFSQVFYGRYKSQIEKEGKKVILNEGGASGQREMHAYKLPLITLKYRTQAIVFPEIHVITDYVSNSHGVYYGNLGQDMIRQFKKMTISFEHSCILFD